MSPMFLFPSSPSLNTAELVGVEENLTIFYGYPGEKDEIVHFSETLLCIVIAYSPRSPINQWGSSKAASHFAK